MLLIGEKGRIIKITLVFDPYEEPNPKFFYFFISINVNFRTSLNSVKDGANSRNGTYGTRGEDLGSTNCSL